MISEDQLRIALLEQMKSNLPVGKLLVIARFRLGSHAARRAGGKPRASRASTWPTPSSIRRRSSMVPRELAKRHRLLPLDYDRRAARLTIAIADVNDIVALDKIRALAAGRHARSSTVLAGESEIARAIDQYYGHELSIDGILHEIETGEIDYRSLAVSTSTNTASRWCA
ncbi:MAG: hypothetical protein MZW92_18230 [Comamonadaceae bacterium]|nr:hypothetical protein [Comamonadaceae bacterium]